MTKQLVADLVRNEDAGEGSVECVAFVRLLSKALERLQLVRVLESRPCSEVCELFNQMNDIQSKTTPLCVLVCLTCCRSAAPATADSPSKLHPTPRSGRRLQQPVSRHSVRHLPQDSVGARYRVPPIPGPEVDFRAFPRNMSSIPS